MVALDRIRLNGPPAPLKPPRLQPGAAIGVAALSGRVDAEKLDRGIAYLRSRGYRSSRRKTCARRPQISRGETASGGRLPAAPARSRNCRDLLRARRMGRGPDARPSRPRGDRRESQDPPRRLRPRVALRVRPPAHRLDLFPRTDGRRRFRDAPSDPETARSWEALLGGEAPEFPIDPADVVRGAPAPARSPAAASRSSHRSRERRNPSTRGARSFSGRTSTRRSTVSTEC